MTLTLLADGLSWLLIGFGAYFVAVGSIGLIRLPSIYTRMHAASLIDGLGAALLLAGLAVQALVAGQYLIALKLVLIYVIIFFTGPVATHAVAQAAMIFGHAPHLVEDRRPEGAQPASIPLDVDGDGLALPADDRVAADRRAADDPGPAADHAGAGRSKATAMTTQEG